MAGSAALGTNRGHCLSTRWRLMKRIPVDEAFVWDLRGNHVAVLDCNSSKVEQRRRNDWRRQISGKHEQTLAFVTLLIIKCRNFNPCKNDLL